jgi:hypothetical protein
VSFEERFFGPGNRISWQAIQDGTLPLDAIARLGPFLDDFRSGRDIVALPRVTPDKRSQWYFLCSSDRHARLARDLARAFLGPSYSDLDHHPRSLDPNDPVDAAVVAGYTGTAFRITIPDPHLVDAARERLHQLISLRREQPMRDPHRLRPIGRILRDFEFALLSKNERTAAALISEVRSAGYLSANNLVFLDVLRLASVEDWRAILALPELLSLLAIERPKRVTEALIRAVYAVHLREFEGTRVLEALRHFKSHVLPRFGGLYRSRALLTGFAIDASFALAAATDDPPKASVVQEILHGYAPGAAERDFIDSIAAAIAPPPSTPEPSTIEDVRTAYAAGDVDLAFRMAMSLAPSFARTGLLLRCAWEMGTLTAATTALNAVAALPASDRERIDGNPTLRRIRDGLKENGSIERDAPIPVSWPQWLLRLNGQDVWRAAVTVAEKGAREWNAADFAQDADAIQTVADRLLQERPSWAKAVLLDSLPHLLAFLGRHGSDTRFRPLYDSLFLLLAADQDVSIPQLEGLLAVIEARLNFGLSAADYNESLTLLADSLKNAATPAVAAIALDAIEILIHTASPMPEQRSAFVGTTAALFQRWSRWITPAQWLLLQELSGEFDLPLTIPQELLVERAEEDEWAELNGKTICLYSLNEAALRRATAVIARLSPAASTRTFHDIAGGSNALKTAARAADIFVIATGAATHAATIFIDSHRPAKATTLRTTGKGSSSLLETLQRHLQQAA